MTANNSCEHCCYFSTVDVFSKARTICNIRSIIENDKVALLFTKAEDTCQDFTPKIRQIFFYRGDNLVACNITEMEFAEILANHDTHPININMLSTNRRNDNGYDPSNSGFYTTKQPKGAN